MKKAIPANGPVADQTAALGRALTELEANGERTMLPPTPCHIRRGHTTRPSGCAALTTARVIWQWRRESGKIALREVQDVAEVSTYNGETLHGVSWVVFRCEGQEIGIGFLTEECARWLDQVRDLLPSAHRPVQDGR